ncbi:hypothetical protein D8B26_003881 [Coccidioides posadasii str. Silveira]|uniref:EKC/KEOPS complex subunit CGI121 n=3 Tax=Coccidioides posadasii TaxID=199306 RepID=E9D989_COCPS|nr:hypothetical protein CPC735_072390 [Coccidioides posadasii C735 delta SOWgp]EER29557.1 hypothetical protein CPC735_072390 [Coccidioides posadasii C735 delta SOWgp]EFW17123.1 hypothetical protein CPSG_06391 [Coccidioides posadasii str. Silveira]KMM70029.1 hypothetical protein CPAG_06341 [Coccidioides posadasii RMSCC 3488]QVM09218.1 hypothetical protein D8B26_003881 [Coccidioides posadasii str. Silveira]|eukprot:XP_003071702.1 hypothetical protein CPC735_072390 [Coccidioides posadasii C735 delta SOWgp]
MSLIETHHLSYLPESHPVHVALYRDLQNASFLREQLLAGNTEFEYAFIDASMIFSRNHIFAAIFRAVRDYINNRLKSKNVHSEIVFSLGGSNNIADAFRRFGISESTRDLLVVKVSTAPEITHESVSKHLEHNVKALPCPFTEESLASMTDRARLMKVYKFGSVGADTFKRLDEVEQGKNGSETTKEAARKHIDMLLMGAIAIRGAT